MNIKFLGGIVMKKIKYEHKNVIFKVNMPKIMKKDKFYEFSGIFTANISVLSLNIYIPIESQSHGGPNGEDGI